MSLGPDVSWCEGGCTFVGDVKYKDAPPSGVLHADLYQLLSYVVASDLPGGLLVYGAGGVSAVHRVALLGRRLEVASLDLAEPPEGILRQVGELAFRIRSLRERSLEAPSRSLA